MSIPIWTLLGFAVWTLVALTASVGVYRWSRILTGRASVGEWRSDQPQGDDWYQRAMRAHRNCLENLPVYAAIVIAAVVSGTSGAAIDALAVAVLAARVCHTLVHIALTQTNAVAGIRFAFYLIQVAAMLAMAAIVTVHALSQS